MPFAVELCRGYKNPPKLTAGIHLAVWDSRRRAEECLRTARRVVSLLLSKEQEQIFYDCFKQDSNGTNCAQIAAVLTKTLAGIMADHTIKLAATAYVPGRWTTGPIHLTMQNYIDGLNERTADVRAWTYVHEATHKFANTDDMSSNPYVKRPEALKDGFIEYPGRIQARDALRNADSYAAFSVMITRRLQGRPYRRRDAAAHAA